MALEQGIEMEEIKKSMNLLIENNQKSLQRVKEIESKLNKSNTIIVISAVMLCIVILSQGLVAGVLTGYIYKLPSNTAESQKGFDFIN